MRKIKGYALISTLLLSGFSSMALPPRLETIDFLQPDNSIVKIKILGDEHRHYNVTEDGDLVTVDSSGFLNYAEILPDGSLRPTGERFSRHVINKKGNNIKEIDLKSIANHNRDIPQFGLGMYKKGYPTEGNPHVLFFLVEFSDVKFSDNYKEDIKSYYDSMLNGENFTDQGALGSVRKYFSDQSSGKFSPVFDIYGPIAVDATQAVYCDDYGQGWDVRANYLIADVAKLLDKEIDYSKYDEDDDGEVDFIYFIVAGEGQHRTGIESQIYPHQGSIKNDGNFVIVDGKWINNYAISNELNGENPEGIGPIVHEYSHVLGLPDLYTVDWMAVWPDPIDFTPGAYTVLDQGTYNNDGHTPPNYTAYERNALQWNEPVVIDPSGEIVLDEISSGEFALLPMSEVNEFYLFENRQLSGWDSYIPNHGMVIWHIDYDKADFSDNGVNIDPQHQRVDLVEANNQPGFITSGKDFTFPGTTGNTSFTPATKPALFAWSGEEINLAVTGIREEDGMISFHVENFDSENPGDNNSISIPEADSDGRYHVYSISGIKLMDTQDPDFIDKLSSGLYIINGKKVLIKK